MSVPTAIDTIIKALADAVPERVAGAHFGSYSSFRIFGRQPDTGALYQMNDSGFGGWGALAGMDGPGPFRTNCHGDTRVIPAEVLEATYPVRVDSFELRTDSGGPGRFRGGLGLTKRYTTLAPLTVSTGFERSRCAPWGILGGDDAEPSRVTIARQDMAPEMVLKDERPIDAGDRVIVETGGGGGFGPVAMRAAASVIADVRDGFEDVDVIGISSLATDHLIVPRLMEALRAAGLGHVGVVVGGIVPGGEVAMLEKAGVARVFHPGEGRAEIVETVAALALTARLAAEQRTK